jgi:hypothetical protein
MAANWVVALPVGPPETVKVLRQMVNEIICLETPLAFMAVSMHYLDFTQVSDSEVVDLLQRLAARQCESRPDKIPAPVYGRIHGQNERRRGYQCSDLQCASFDYNAHVKATPPELC